MNIWNSTLPFSPSSPPSRSSSLSYSSLSLSAPYIDGPVTERAEGPTKSHERDLPPRMQKQRTEPCKIPLISQCQCARLNDFKHHSCHLRLPEADASNRIGALRPFWTLSRCWDPRTLSYNRERCTGQQSRHVCRVTLLCTFPVRPIVNPRCVNRTTRRRGIVRVIRYVRTMIVEYTRALWPGMDLTRYSKYIRCRTVIVMRLRGTERIQTVIVQRRLSHSQCHLHTILRV